MEKGLSCFSLLNQWLIRTWLGYFFQASSNGMVFGRLMFNSAQFSIQVANHMESWWRDRRAKKVSSTWSLLFDFHEINLQHGQHFSFLHSKKMAKLRSCNHCAFVWVCRMCLEAWYVEQKYIYGTIYCIWHFRSRCSRFSHERLKVSVLDGNCVQDYAVVSEPPKHCEVARSRWEVLRHLVDSEWKHPWGSSVSCSRAWPGGKCDHLLLDVMKTIGNHSLVWFISEASMLEILWHLFQGDLVHSKLQAWLAHGSLQ